MKNQVIVNQVKNELATLGLSNLSVSINKDEEGSSISVRWEEGAFGNHSEMLNRYFNIGLFMSYFRGRSKWLALTADERAKVNMHPQRYQEVA